MSILLNCEDTASIGLDELTYGLEHEIKTRDDESLIECAPLLRRLGNNKTFLASSIAAQLKSRISAHSLMTPFPEPSLELYSSKDFQVRAVFWFPPTMFPLSRRWQAKSLSYLQAHDHEHSFLTIGYYGPGYLTHLYECDPDAIRGIPGERVELIERPSQSISEGKMMIYQESRDVHIQDHAADFSITLNIALKSRIHKKPQTLFNLDNNTVTLSVTSEAAHFAHLFQIAQHLEDSTTASAIEHVAETHPENEIRIQARKHLAHSDPGNAANHLRALETIGTPEARAAMVEISRQAEGRNN